MTVRDSPAAAFLNNIVGVSRPWDVALTVPRSLVLWWRQDGGGDSGGVRNSGGCDSNSRWNSGGRDSGCGRECRRAGRRISIDCCSRCEDDWTRGRGSIGLGIFVERKVINRGCWLAVAILSECEEQPEAREEGRQSVGIRRNVHLEKHSKADDQGR